MLGTAFADVLVAAQTGAGWAFTRLYEDLAGIVTAYLRRQGATDPDDLTSETFLHVFRGIAGFEGGEPAFRSWVLTIAHRRLIDQRRAAGRRPTSSGDELPDVPAAGADADGLVVAREQQTDLDRHLAVLTEAQRDVVLLRVVAGLAVDETAATLGRSEDAVRQLQHRALRTLRDHLGEDLRGDLGEAERSG